MMWCIRRALSAPLKASSMICRPAKTGGRSLKAFSTASPERPKPILLATKDIDAFPISRWQQFLHVILKESRKFSASDIAT